MKTNLLKMIIALAILFGFIIGLCAGIEIGERKAFEKLGIMFEGSTINVNFNETYIMDRTEEIVNETTKYLIEEFTREEKAKILGEELNKNCIKDYTGRTC